MQRTANPSLSPRTVYASLLLGTALVSACSSDHTAQRVETEKHQPVAQAPQTEAKEDDRSEPLRLTDAAPSRVIATPSTRVPAEERAPALQKRQSTSATQAIMAPPARSDADTFQYPGHYPPLPVQPQPAQDRERYAGFNDNPTRAVADDPLSTFAIDVDTASYTLARDSLNRGLLPQAESVRTEEWINFFRYDYPRPRNRSVPFSVTTEIAPAPWNPDKQLMLVGLQGYDVETAALPPLNLTFLIDVSGSMSAANKLPLAKQTLKLLTARLRPQDSVAIVVYAGAAGQVLPPTPGDQKQTIIAALDRLQAGGSTAGGAGIQLAYASARQRHTEEGISRVILLSDGDFNVGVSSTDALKRMVARERASGISLSVLTFGRGNIRDELMNTLAETGNGNAAFIDNAHEARRYMVDQMSGSLMTIAKDVKVQLEFNPEWVASYRLLGYETRHLAHRDFDNDRKDAGEIGAGHSVTALYELTLNDSPAAHLPSLRYQRPSTLQRTGPNAEVAAELAFLKLRYKQPDAEHSQLISLPITEQQRRLNLNQASANLRWAAAVAGGAQLTRGQLSPDEWNYDDSIRLANTATGSDDQGYRHQFIQLMRTAATLQSGLALQGSFENAN